MPTKKSPSKALTAEVLMTRRVVACRAHTDLAHVARLMWENDCGIVPVVDTEDRVVGVVTDRDLCMSAQFRGRPLQELAAGECMATELVTAAPSEPAAALAQRMGARGVRRLPITDADGRLLGLVALSDLFRALSDAPATAGRALEKALVSALGSLSAPRTPEVLEPVAPPAPKARKAAKARSRAAAVPAQKKARKRQRT